MISWWWKYLVFIFLRIISAFSANHDRVGPSFVMEPASRIDFLNSTGTVIPCTARGIPTPSISWMKKDGSTVGDIPGLRHIRPDGSLVFSPFPAEDYRQDVHSAVYRCVSSNVAGTIGSRDVVIRAAVKQYYEAQVYDVFVTRGNTAVLQCHIPSFVKEYVSVTSWIRDDGLNIQSDTISGSRYSVFQTGELHIRHVEPTTDGRRKYYCQTMHRISGEVKRSSSFGQLVVTDPHSNFPPRIINRKPSVIIRQGETVELPCAAEGYPLPTITWYKEQGSQSTPIQTNQRYLQLGGTLVIQKTVIQDSGKYACFVNNTVGQEKVETDLLVTAPIAVSVSPKLIIAVEGDIITLNCSISGYPVQSLMWMKNLEPIVSNSRIQYLSKDVLQINSVIREDKGMYQCFAYNDQVSAQGAAELTLGDDPPVFSYTFHEQTLQPGPFVSLKCAATGTPLPQITWSLDGFPISENMRIRVGDFVNNDGYVNSFVNITSLKSEDSGKYSCHASNEVATVSYSANLNVFGPPFIRQMKNITVLSGNTLSIRCPVAGYPIEKITWEKEKTKLPQNRRQTSHPNGTLTIQKIDRSNDQGWYRCSAINSRGESAVREVYVKVLIAPVISPFYFAPSIKEGMRSMITCAVAEGDSPITIKWLKNGHLLSDNSNVKIDSNNEFLSILFIKRVTYNDNGNYTCVASNDAATTNYTATMIVNVPPSWKIIPVDKSVTVGDSIVIDCQADGFPEPRIWWEKSSGSLPGDYQTIISNSHIHTLENGSLMIKEIEQNDAGFYLCQATNSIGSGLSKVVELTVHVAAYFKAKFSALALKKGDNAQLQCQAFGELPITITWRKDRQSFEHPSDPRYEIQQIEQEDSILSTLIIKSIDRRDSALFTCLAVNAYGQDDTNIQLIIQEPPDSPTDILASEISSRSITVRWTQPYNGNSPITAFKIQYKEASDSWETAERTTSLSGRETTSMIRGLRPVTNYHIRVMAENALGWSDPSQVVHITTMEETPEGPPLGVRAVPTASQSIRVTWQPPRKEMRNGIIRGYYVGYKIYGTNEAYIYKTLNVHDNFKEEVILTNLKRATKYSIIVQAFNSKGNGPPSEELILETLQNDPPVSPMLMLVSTTATSIHLKWNYSDKEDSPVTGYFLYHMKQHGTWEERQVPSHQTTYTFHDLSCGTHHQFYIIAFNTVGKGKPSDVIGIKTQGSVPIAPTKDALFTINATSVVLHLNTWHSVGCPINYFVVQYKAHIQSEWILLSNNIVPEQKVSVLSDLSPGTWYTLLMTAHSDAGAIDAEYIFSTLTLSGATIPPLSSTDDRRPTFYKSLSIMVPSACALVVLIVILIVACVVVRKRRQLDNLPRRGIYISDSRLREEKGLEGMSMSVLDRKHTGSTGSGSPTKDQLYYPSPYAMSRVPMYHKQHSPDSESGPSLQRTLGRHEHIYDVPYPPKWEEEDDAYSHIMETSSVPLHAGTNLYQTPRVLPLHYPIKAVPPLPPDRQYRKSQRLNYKSSSLASDGHSGDESDSEGTTYTFSREPPGSYLDSHEMSEAECDRDNLEHHEKCKKYFSTELIGHASIT